MTAEEEYFKNSLLKDFEYLILNYGFKFVDFPRCLDYEYPDGDRVTICAFNSLTSGKKVYYYITYYPDNSKEDDLIRNSHLMSAKEIIDYIEM
jgi:uncharacterized radical SAM superfamily Fe-S cluster-containing enzyme